MLEDKEVVEEEKVISEKDGKIIATVPEDFEEIETDEEGEEEVEEVEEVEEEETTEDDDADDVKEKYVGKSAEELVEMLQNRDVTIGKQGTEISKYKDVDPSLLSKDELKAKLTAKDLRTAVLTNKKDIRAARQKLSDLDSDIDGSEKVKAAEDKLNEMLDAQDALELDLGQKISDETINKKFASQENIKFLKEKKVEFSKKLGIKSKDFDEIVEASKGYAGDDGIITLNTLGKGMIDLKNYEGVAKLHEISGNSKARKEIVKAIKKGEKKISTTSKGGKRTKSIEITDDMSLHETKRIISNMPNNELFEGIND